MTVRIQAETFDSGMELARFEAAQGPGVGAVVSFLGRVRDHSLTLEHYPGMAEREAERIIDEARRRWPITDVLVIHRYGRLGIGEPIVFVATASAHREAAFTTAGFIMDFLKTRAPFWKKEAAGTGDHWVEAQASDDDAAARWK